MRPEVASGWMAWNAPFEGSVPFFYCDVKGLVTIAIGNLVDPIETALGLPMTHPDGRPATREEISAAWHIVKAHQDMKLGGGVAYGRLAGNELRLTPDGVAVVVLAKLAQIGAFLGQRFPEFEQWPWQAQQATLSMSWAEGPAFNAPRFSAAVKAWDWATAAVECHLDDSHNPGLVPRNAANRALFLAAAHEHDGDGPAASETETSDTKVGPI